jgi:hypothetical protein
MGIRITVPLFCLKLLKSLGFKNFYKERRRWQENFPGQRRRFLHFGAGPAAR